MQKGPVNLQKFFSQKGKLKLGSRNIIPNGSKLFSQADIELNIGHYLSSDIESKKIFDILVKQTTPKFQFLDLSIPYNEALGILDL